MTVISIGIYATDRQQMEGFQYGELQFWTYDRRTVKAYNIEKAAYSRMSNISVTTITS